MRLTAMTLDNSKPRYLEQIFISPWGSRYRGLTVLLTADTRRRGCRNNVILWRRCRLKIAGLSEVESKPTNRLTLESNIRLKKNH